MIKQDIAAKLREELKITNLMAVPRITKVVVNVGLKEAVGDKSVLDKVGAQLAAITGQKAKVTRAKTSIANFKVRAGDPVGLAATLRGKRMWDFLTRLVTLVLPRVRDFHGVPKSAFDGQGNYSLGLTEQIVFPEIDYAKIDKIRGLQITITTTCGDDAVARRLLELVGFPFAK